MSQQKNILITELSKQRNTSEQENEDQYFNSLSTKKEFDIIFNSNNSIMVKNQSVSFKENEELNKKSSFFKIKTDFNKPKNKLLDYFLNNHTEYIDLQKYEEYYEVENKKQNNKISALTKEHKHKLNYIKQLDQEINEELITKYRFTEESLTSKYEDKIKWLKNKISEVEYDYTTDVKYKEKLVEVNVSLNIIHINRIP